MTISPETLTQDFLQDNYWQELAELLEKESARASSPEATGKALLEVGKIYFFELKQWKRAHETLTRALELTPAHPALLSTCEALALTTKDAALYQEVCQLRLRQATASLETKLPELLIEMGTHWLERFDDAERAQNYLEQAKTAAPQSPTMLRALAACYEKQKDWLALAKLYQDSLDKVDAATHYALRIKLFFLNFYKLRDPETAAAVLQPIVSANAQTTEAGVKDQQPLLLQSRALSQLKRWKALTANLDQLARSSRDTNLIKSYLLQRADICHSQCSETESAIMDLRQVLTLDPENRGAIQRLIHIHRSERHYAKLVPLLTMQLKLDYRDQRESDIISHTLEVVELWENQLKQPEKAVLVLEESAKILPTALPLLSVLARKYAEAQKWQELKQLYELELSAADDINQQLSLHYRLGNLFEGPLNDARQAAEYYRKALTLSPDYLPAHQRLTSIYTEKSLWQEMIDLFELELAAVDNEQRAIYLLGRMASVHEEKLNNPSAAEAVYQRLLQIDKSNIGAVGALARIYFHAGEWEKLAQMNLREAELCGDPRQSISLYYNSGTIFEEKLRDLDKAAMCYQNVLSIAPTYTPALRALGSIYARRQNWGGMIAMYQREAQVTSRPSKHFYLLTTIAELYRSKLQDNRSAEKVLQEVLKKNPNALPAARLLENIFIEEKRYEELTQLYRSLIHHEDADSETMGTHAYKLAKLLHLELARVQESEPYYLTSIEHNCNATDSLTALDQIFSDDGRFQELADLLRSVLPKVEESAYRLNILYRLGIITIEYLDEPDIGLDYLLEAYRSSPSDPALLWDLTHYLKRFGAWEELARVYTEQAHHTKAMDEGARLELMLQAAATYRLASNFTKALMSAEAILAINPAHLPALQLLTDLHRQSGDFQKLTAVLSRIMELESDWDKRLAAGRELAEVYESKQSQPDQATAVLEKLLRQSPETNFSLMMALEKLYRNTHDWQKLKSLYPLLRQGLRDPTVIVKLGLRHTEALEQLQENSMALKVYEEILPRARYQPDLRNRYKNLLKRLEKWSPLIDLLEEEAQVDSGATAPLLELADIIEQVQQDYERAKSVLLQALKRDQHSTLAHQALARIYLALKAYDDYLQISDAELKLSPTEDRQLALRLERGRARRDLLKQLPEAVEEFRLGLERQPVQAELLKELAQTYNQMEKWQEAMQIYEQLLATLAINISSSTEDKERAANHFYHLGEIGLNGLKDEQRCIDYNEKALTLTPYFEPSLKRLQVIYLQKNDWKKLTLVYQRSIDVLRVKEPERALPLHIELGELYEFKLKQAPQAITEYQRALQLRRDFLPAHEHLSQIYAKNPQHHGQAVHELIYLLDKGPPRQETFREIARLFELDNKFDHLCRTYEAMDFLDILSPEHREIYHSYASRIPKEPKGVLDRLVAQRNLFHPDEQQPLSEFYQQIFRELGVLSKYNRKTLELTRKQRLTDKDDHPLRLSVNRICTALQLDDVELYLKPNLGVPAAVVTLDGYALALDTQWLKSWNKHQLNFFLAYHLSQLINHRAIALDLEPYRFEHVVRLMLLPFLADVPPDSEEINTDIRLIKTALSRNSRKWLEESGEKWAERLARTNFSAWVNGIRLTSIRTGLLFCNQLSEAVHAIKHTLPELANAKVWENDLTRQMILYTLSDESAHVRKAIGTSIYSV